MKKHYMNWVVLASAVFAMNCSFASAQVRVGAPSVIGTKLTTKINPPQAQAGQATNAMNLFVQPLRAQEEQFITDRNVSVGYTHSFKDSKRRSDPTEEDLDVFGAQMYLETRTGFSVNPTFEFALGSSDTRRLKRGDSEGYAAGLGLGQELLKLLNYDSQRASVTLAADASYRWEDRRERTFAGVRDSSEAKGWDAGVGLGLSYAMLLGKSDDDATGKLVGTITPTYRYEREDVDASPDTRESGELLTVEGRIDYVLTKALTLTVLTTWNHDLAQRVPRTEPNPRNRDWADFAFQPSLNLGSKWKLSATVGFEAFHPDYDRIRGGIELFYLF